MLAGAVSGAEPELRLDTSTSVAAGAFDDRSAPSTYQYDAPPYSGWLGPPNSEFIGVNVFNAVGGVGGSDLLSSISCVWRNVANGSTQRVFIWQDDGSGVLANAKFLAEQSVVVANANTDTINAYPLAAPVPVTGRFYVGFSSVFDGVNGVLAFDNDNPPAFPDRAFLGAVAAPFNAAAPGAIGVLSPTTRFGSPGYFALRANGVGSAFTYQGRLANAGQNYTGNADFIFTIYDKQSGGAVVGSPIAMANVPVSVGVFSVQIPADPSWFVNAPDRYLDVQVRTPADGATYSTIAPRGRIGQVPAAMVATVAQTAQTVPWSGVTGVPESVTPWAPVPTGIAYSGTNVGIGTTSPQARLHIVDGPPFQNLNVDSSFAQGTWFNFFNTSPGGRLWSLISTGQSNSEGAGALLIRDTSAAAVRAAFLPNGNVGIKTTTPEGALDVAGTIGMRNTDSLFARNASGSLETWMWPRWSDDWMYTNFGASGWAIRTNDTTNVMTMLPNGNVGVGNVSPETRLWVGGSAQILTGAFATSGMLAFGTLGNLGLTAEGSDAVFFQRRNSSSNVVDLRLVIGDDPTSNAASADYFTIGSIPSGTWTPAFQFRMDGLASKPGGGTWATISDPRTKHDASPLKGTLDRLLSLRGYQYYYNEAEIKNGRALPGVQIGLMADEVEQVFPDWVSRDKDGMRMVTERSTTALMVEALRDLRAEKDEQIRQRDARIEALEARLLRLEAAIERGPGGSTR
jgi:hypothetical protein